MGTLMARTGAGTPPPLGGRLLQSPWETSWCHLLFPKTCVIQAGQPGSCTSWAAGGGAGELAAAWVRDQRQVPRPLMIVLLFAVIRLQIHQNG